MSDIHIDEFFHDAAKAIVSLYTMFPRPVTLFAEDISGPDEPDEYGVHNVRYLACFSTLVWLGEQGYLNYTDTIRQDAIDQAVLTGKCFSALLAASELPGTIDATLPPSVQRHQRTIIFGLQQAVKAKSSEQMRQAFAPLMARLT